MCLQASDTESFILSLCNVTYADMNLLKAFEKVKFNTSGYCTSHQRPQNSRDAINFLCFCQNKGSGVKLSNECCFTCKVLDNACAWIDQVH